MMMHPMPDVKISVYEEYLDAAKKYFESMGWKWNMVKC